MSLRDQVESVLPNWRSWYPSVFDAAVDLGIIRARVCAPSSLLLSNRHASVYNEALQAFREKWSVVEPEGENRDAERVTRDTQEGDTHAGSDSDASRVTHHGSRFHR
jgi:hypothetical protein